MVAELEQQSDEELARQSQAGSLDAFEALVLRYERRIYGFILQTCPNPADAAEVAQETFLKAFRAIRSYKPRHPFAGWLFTIARHNCIDHHRAAPPPAEPLTPERVDDSDPARALASRDDGRGLWALAKQVLPPMQYQALWLTYASGMQVREIAQVLERTTTHVKVMLFRARRTLRRALEESRPDLLPARRSSGFSFSLQGVRFPAATAPAGVLQAKTCPPQPSAAASLGRLTKT